VISLEQVTFRYPGGPEVLRGLDFRIRQGDRVGIVGPNGSGKTTLLHLIVGLLRPTSGRVVLFGRERTTEADFRDARRRMGFVFQDADDQLFCPTVAEDVAFGPLNLGKPADEVREIVRSTLGMLGIEHLEHRVTYQLSGGEKRIVALATVLAMNPDVLILDEPTTGLDEATTDRVVEILDRHVPSYLVVSHDWSFLERTVSRVTRLEEGRLVPGFLGSVPRSAAR